MKRVIYAVMAWALCVSAVACDGGGSGHAARGVRSAGGSDVRAADSVRVVVGRLVLGHEVRSFVEEGDTAVYWLKDDTGRLADMYDSVTGGVKNGRAVRAKLEVERSRRPADGFAADYAGVYEVKRVMELEAEQRCGGTDSRAGE